MGVKNRDGLTPKRAEFARLVAEGKTLREAYRKAFSAGRMQEKTIDRKAGELMKDARVKAKVEKIRARIEEKAERESVMSCTEVLHELSMIASGKGEYPVYGLDGKLLGNRPASMSARLRSLELLARSHGAFTERVNVTSTEPFKVTITTLPEEKSENTNEEASK